MPIADICASPRPVSALFSVLFVRDASSGRISPIKLSDRLIVRWVSCHRSPLAVLADASLLYPSPGLDMESISPREKISAFRVGVKLIKFDPEDLDFAGRINS